MSNCKANESLQTKSLHLPTHMWIVSGIETCLPLLHNYCIYVCYVSIRCFNWCWTFKITMCRLVARAGALPRIHGGNTTARLVVGWDFQLSFENHLNWAFLRNFWRIRPLHSAQGYGRHNVSTRCSAFFPSAKGQIWESKISTDLRILDHISQNHLIYKFFIVVHSYFVSQICCWFLPFITESLMFLSNQVWPFGKGRGLFFGPPFSINFGHSFRTQSNRVIREGARMLKVKQNPQRTLKMVSIENGPWRSFAWHLSWSRNPFPIGALNWTSVESLDGWSDR